MKITAELIEAYLDGSLSPAQTAKLKAWLEDHKADAAKVRRQESLRAVLRASGPQLSEKASRQMWSNIRARVKAEAAPVPVLDLREPWYAFLFRPWAGASFAAAALALIALVWQPWHGAAPQPAPLAQEVASAGAVASAAQPAAAEKKEAPMKDVAAAPARERELSRKAAEPVMAKVMGGGASRAMEADQAPAAAMMAMAAPAPAARDDRATGAEPTEVEKALADSGVDGMIDAYLQQQRQGVTLRNQRMDQQPGLGFSRSGGGSSLAGLTQTLPSGSDNLASVGTAQGHPDNNGFWDWNPAAVALNRRDWQQARLELLEARDKASESAERSFAGSALTLLSAPGAPLAGQGDALPQAGDLRVLGAGRWQLLVDSRLARFSQGVSARLPGFRAEGDSLLLDLTFDRGTFGPGTRFIRLAGEKAATVTDAQGSVVSSDEFNAPSGATYNVSGQELKLR